jgi:hypothetical protein
MAAAADRDTVRTLKIQKKGFILKIFENFLGFDPLAEVGDSHWLSGNELVLLIISQILVIR